MYIGVEIRLHLILQANLAIQVNLDVLGILNINTLYHTPSKLELPTSQKVMTNPPNSLVKT